MLEPRIYRAAFIPALFAFVIAMFSLESRPAPVPQALAADILFDGNVALGGTQHLAAQFPDRRPGTAGDRAAGAQMAATLRGQHFDVRVDRFNSDGADLVNVVGRRIGESTRQLVVVAPRDADRVPDVAGSAADTASLAEIARTLEGRVTQNTLVLASVDGSTLGSVGAQRLAGQLSTYGPVEAIIVLTDMGVARANGSMLVPWSDTTARGGVRLEKTIGDSLRLELQRGGAGRSAGTAGQFDRLALPLGIGDQAPFVDAGFNALRLSGSGELPPPRARQPPPSADRLGAIGRATLRTVFAYDAGGEVAEQPSSFIGIGQKMLPRWSVALFVFTLLLPLFAASVDSFARVRRRREPVVPWLRLMGGGVLAFLVALAVAELLVLVGEAPDLPAVPPPPQSHTLHGSGWVSLGLCTAFFLAVLLVVRPRLAGDRGAPDSPGRAAALALAMSLVALALWVVNPFAALAFVPAFHLWLVVTATPVAPPRAAGAAMVLAGLLVPALVAIGVLDRLGIGPVAGVWYGFLLVASHQIGFYTAMVGAVLATCFATALRIAVTPRSERYRPR